MFYDPMICKLTAYGGSREEAIATSINALDHYVIRGGTHNIPLLRDVLTEPTFNSGTFTTNYLLETYPEGFQGVQLTGADKLSLSSLAAVIYFKEAARARQRLNSKGRSGEVRALSLVVEVKGEMVGVKVVRKEGSFLVLSSEGSVEVLDNFSLADTVINTNLNGENVVAQLIRRDSNGLRIR